MVLGGDEGRGEGRGVRGSEEMERVAGGSGGGLVVEGEAKKKGGR